MDAAELRASLQALMDQRKQAAPDPPIIQDVPVTGVPGDPYERYFAPAAEVPAEPYRHQFDDYLLNETEEAGTVTATKSATATHRATRTGKQGLLVSVLIAVGTVLANLALDAGIDWRILGLSLGQAVVTAVLSFLHTDNRASE